MVRPAAKREAVAYLREHFQMSERRACSVLAADQKMIRYTSQRPTEKELRERFETLPMNAEGSAIAGCSSCCSGRVSPRASTAYTGSTVRKG